MMINVKGYQPSSMIEWPGKIVSILYTAGCNLRCPFCHNQDLVRNYEKTPDLDFDEIMGKIKSRKAWIDAVEFTGGEPLLHPHIEEMAKRVKDAGFLVKLDTNGCFPGRLKNLIDKKLIDYIAMDVKAPLDKYEKVVRAEVDTEKIKESIRLIMGSGLDYEFRTTVVPKLHSKKDVEEIAKLIKGAKKYWLQNFRNKNTLDSSFSNERPFTKKEMMELAKVAEKYVNKVETR